MLGQWQLQIIWNCGRNHNLLKEVSMWTESGTALQNTLGMLSYPVHATTDGLGIHSTQPTCLSRKQVGHQVQQYAWPGHDEQLPTLVRSIDAIGLVGSNKLDCCQIEANSLWKAHATDLSLIGWTVQICWAGEHFALFETVEESINH